MVQSHNHEEWNYTQKLNQFVMGGMIDGYFIHDVSSIITLGCHLPPCKDTDGMAVEMYDSGNRWDYFQQVARTLGLSLEDTQR